MSSDAAKAPTSGVCVFPWTASDGGKHSCAKWSAAHAGSHRCGCGEIYVPGDDEEANREQ